MTNIVVPGGGRPPPTPAAKGVAQPARDRDDDALGFLALLAILGPHAGDATDADQAASDTAATDTQQGDASHTTTATRHRGKRDGRDTDLPDDPIGVVRAHPIFPAPIILGTPTATGDGRAWRTGDPTATGGAKGAHPILPDVLPGQGIGDVAQSPSAEQDRMGTDLANGAVTSRAASLSQLGDVPEMPDGGAASASLRRLASGVPSPAAPSPQGGAMPFTGILPMSVASGVQPALPVPTAPPGVNAAPPVAASSAPRRRIGPSDPVAGGGGAFAITDARLGSVATTGGTGATTAPMHPAAVNAAREIVAQAQLVGRGQSAEMRLRLRPPDLGDVGVTIRRNAAGGLTVHLVPASPEAAAVLRTHLPHLQSALDPHSQGQGAHVTLGQHDASGSSHRQGGSDTQHRDDSPSALSPIADVARPAHSARGIRGAAIDYDA